MPITVKAPWELQATLAKMRAAKEQGIGMNVWDSEIKAVEDAIALINAIRDNQQKASNCPFCGATPEQSHDPNCGLGR